MRGGLRSRLFQAIGVVVLICVALTIGLGLVLTRRAVDRATVQDLTHQAALIGPQLRNSISAQTSLDHLKRFFRQQDELPLLTSSAGILPSAAQAELARHPLQPAEGTLTYDGTAYYFAAESLNPQTFILLRPQSAAGSRWSPYIWGLLV